MKFVTFFILTFSFVSNNIIAQEVVWLDAELSKTDSSKGIYYRIGTELNKEVSYFYKNRNIYRKVYYEKGKLEGKFLEFYETGELKTIGNYENGLKEGVWKTYYVNGKMREKGKYESGKKVGVWKTFYKNL